MQRLRDREAKERVRKKREGDEEKKDEGERVGRERWEREIDREDGGERERGRRQRENEIEIHTGTETGMKQRETHYRESQRKMETGPRLFADPAGGAKACGPSSLKTQQEAKQLPIRETVQRVKDRNL